ncbi:ExbD/TolR family protein [Albidovulum sp.]|uniref:ExbD/TolR family protein n=1 Tax=Albidovulum sp. TaxID=1872424 RepID=UPI001D273CFA|nr:biopolymer transporter ExbD [Paracoccaceae bacterium]MCC0046475.1 biopolymer transporter ExbD [Defluviimonas sp.]HPE26174.1 biopolymer transporter ExbD [Albidovulum sp.]MCB2119465.1 biopolymer transporter ExbD [Paracoccaceae bacterium]MCB2132574.1 biopolymer transporter ExbD [Paracoccaceae bacterium]
MKLRRTPPRTEPETIVALIDVVLFLLIFFMLIGRMDATAPFMVFPATAQTGQNLPAGGETVSIAGDGRMALNGHEMTADALRQALSSAVARDPALVVRINAHRDAELRHTLALTGALDELGVKDIVLIVTPKEP